MHQRLQVLILILIAGVGCLFLVPAVLQVREALNRQLCLGQLRQIAIASHYYHTDHQRLPPGWVGPNPDRAGMAPAPHVGVLAYLAPYLTQERKIEEPYFQRDLDASTEPGAAQGYAPPADAFWWTLTNPKTGRSNRQVVGQHFPALLCPSADNTSPSEGWITALHAYGKERKYFNGFLVRFVVNSAECPESVGWGRTHYLGVAGRFGKGDDCAGIFTNRSRLTLGQITVCDGTGHTLLLGEATGGLDAGRSPDRATAYSWLCGALPTYYGLPSRLHRPWNAFNGPHYRRVQFAFADGSVRGLKRFVMAGDWQEDGSLTVEGTQPWNVFQSLAGYKDGMSYE